MRDNLLLKDLAEPTYNSANYLTPKSVSPPKFMFTDCCSAYRGEWLLGLCGVRSRGFGESLRALNDQRSAMNSRASEYALKWLHMNYAHAACNECPV